MPAKPPQSAALAGTMPLRPTGPTPASRPSSSTPRSPSPARITGRPALGLPHTHTPPTMTLAPPQAIDFSACLPYSSSTPPPPSPLPRLTVLERWLWIPSGFSVPGKVRRAWIGGGRQGQFGAPLKQIKYHLSLAALKEVRTPKWNRSPLPLHRSNTPSWSSHPTVTMPSEVLRFNHTTPTTPKLAHMGWTNYFSWILGKSTELVATPLSSEQRSELSQYFSHIIK